MALPGGSARLICTSRCEPLQSTEQEGAGANRRVEQRECVKDGRGPDVAVSDPAFGFPVSTTGSLRNQGGESGIEQLLYQERGRIEGSRGVSCFGRHDALEHPPQHIWRDCTTIALVDCKAEVVEQPLKCVPPDLIRDVRSVPPLQPVWLKKPPVQEWNVSESPCCPAPHDSRLIQRSKKEWAQEIAMDFPARCKAAIDFLGQKSFSSCEPTLGLDKVQKQHPGQLQ
jgi:hypothetical protein